MEPTIDIDSEIKYRLLVPWRSFFNGIPVEIGEATYALGRSGGGSLEIMASHEPPDHPVTHWVFVMGSQLDILMSLARTMSPEELNKILKTILADTPLVRNLENNDYLKIILNGCSTLEERFSQIDDKIVREKLKQAKKNQEKIPPEIKGIIKQSDLPEKISSSFLIRPLFDPLGGKSVNDAQHPPTLACLHHHGLHRICRRTEYAANFGDSLYRVQDVYREAILYKY